MSGSLVRLCRAYVKTPDLADVVHSAVCLKADAVLVKNDKDFGRIREERVIEVWDISEALERLL